MKTFDDLIKHFQRLPERLEKNLMGAQQKACTKICEDIKADAPVRTGAYRDSIKVSETVKKGNRIYTQIYSDMAIGGDNEKWASVPLAAIIESGTSPHDIFPRRRLYLRWEDDAGIVHFAKHVYHPGTAPNPHWISNIMKNQSYYKRMILKGRLWKV